MLDFARREAKKLLVGKTGYGPSCKQDDINALMVSLARQGKRVVRLKGGDPLIFGRAGEEIAACKAANIAVEVVPGITAAQGAAASLALPLTDRKHARRLQYVTGHAKDGKMPEDIDWQSLADPATTTAIYMPARTIAALVTRATAEGTRPHDARSGDRLRDAPGAKSHSGADFRTCGANREGRSARTGPGPVRSSLRRTQCNGVKRRQCR